MRLLTIFIAVFFIVSCTPTEKVVVRGMEEAQQMAYRAEMYEDRIRCNDPGNYAPGNVLWQLEPEKVIRLNYHFVNSIERKHNFSGKDALLYAQSLTEDSNRRWKNNIKMNLPEGNDTPVYDPKIQIKLVDDPTTSSGRAVYDPVDDDLYYFVNKGRNMNNYNRAIVDKYEINTDSVLNVFLMPHHPDSIRSTKYNNGPAGIAMGHSLKVGGVYLTDKNPGSAWRIATTLNHEIGHILGLRHSWIKNDLCDDTPPHPNCWDNTGPPPCDGLISNNMMDYNNQQMAITPCQIGVMRANIYDERRPIRTKVVEDYCHYDATQTWVVSDTVLLDRSFDFRGDIIIKPQAYLRLTCRIHMPRGGRIIVEPEGTLEINGAKVHNACGDYWKGIELQNKGRKRARLILRAQPEIRNVYPEGKDDTANP